MAPALAAAPRPRANVQRRKPVIHRVPGSDKRTGSTPFRASTPLRQTTPGRGRSTPSPQMRACPSGCVNPTVKHTDDLAWICQSCGAEVEVDDQLVSETQFAEGPSGQIRAQGVTIGVDETHRGGGTFAHTGHSGKTSASTSAQAESNAKTIITRISSGLHLSGETDAALRLFKMAYTKGFIRGRSLDDVALVCLYLAARQSHEQIEGVRRPKHPYMLIDFAERGDIDVFALGRIYVDLCRELFFDPGLGMQPDRERGPILAPGPEVFVERFVRELEFPKHEERRIMNDAYHIIASMRRDWITRGRRPAGVCGAAVILAARMNNYRRTVREVVLVAKVTEITLNKRLEEFSSTLLSKVSVSEFRGQELPPASDAHLTASALADLQNKRKDRNMPTFDDLPEASNPPIMNPRLKKRRRKTAAGTAETVVEIEDDQSSDEEQDQEEEQEADEDESPAPKRARLDPDGFAIPGQPASSTPQPASSASTSKRRQGRPKGSKNWRAPPPSARETALEQEIEGDIDENMPEMEEAAARMTRARSEAVEDAEPLRDQTAGTGDESVRPRGNSETVTGPTPPPTDTESILARGNSGETPMSPTLHANEFEDDLDVSTCILNEEERRLKETIWVNENAEWLRQDHAKRIRRQLKEAELREKGIDPAQFEKNKKAQGRRRKDGSKVPGRAGDIAYLTNSEYERRGESRSSRTPSEPAAGKFSQSGTNSPDRADSLNAADSVTRMLGQRAGFSRRLNLDAVKGIYARPSNAAGSPTPSDSRASSVLSEESDRRASVSQDRIAQTAAERRRRMRAGLPEDQDRSNVIFGGVGGKNTGLARSKASLSAERRQLAMHDKSRGSGSPSVEPSGQDGRQQSMGYEESVASVSGSPTPPPVGPSRVRAPQSSRNVTFAKSPPQQRSAPGSGPHTPTSMTGVPSAGIFGAGEEEVLDEVVGERSLIREVAPPGAYADDDDDEDDDMDEDEEPSEDEAESEMDPEDAFAGNARPNAWDDD